ncbi:MAG: glycosyltransferase family 4 protein [Elusimicrobia bacterium]|jgi:glycosyltransferase involved in cell wall biosynthesis|nr:glycosyltransferase family 4 protein [Elusimicrobiota bacterium]
MSGKIKVVHIITLLEWGGAQQTVLTLVGHLNRDLFAPVLYCGRGGILDGDAKHIGIPVRFVPGLRRPIRPWWDFLVLINLYRFLRSERPHLVHTHSSKAGVLGRLAAWLAGVPIVVHTVHGFGFTPVQKKWVRGLFVRVERWLARITSALVFVSKSNREEALLRGIGSSDRHHLIRAAVHLDEYQGMSRDPKVLLNSKDRLVTTIGPFKPQKNLLDFIRAAAIVAVLHPDVKFLVIGDGQGREMLEKEIQSRNLTHRVLLAGWRPDIPALLGRSDIFCMTSLWEGLPMSLVEAMAVGLPCVVNAVDGCRDVIVHGVNGFLTPPGDPSATAERLDQLLKNPVLAKEIGQRAKASIGREFDKTQMVLEHEKLYTTLFTMGGEKRFSSK